MKESLELLLIRHGKAQKRGTVTLDQKRRLVPKGIKQLKEDIPYLLAFLENRKKVYLWSSEVVRAMETAEIIKKICDIDEIRVHDFIKTGNFQDLKHSLKNIGEDSTVIIVGHEPDLSDWTYKISKKNVVFKKGTAVLIQIHPAEKLVGEIKWIAEPGDYQQVLNENEIKNMDDISESSRK